MFAGREDVLRTVIRSIEDQKLHVVLYGERGIGKTSLLHMLAQAAGEARYIVVYTSCGANSNFDDTIRAVAADIPLLYHSGFAPTTEEAERGETLLDLLPSGPVTPRQFADLATKLTGTRVLIILDEFDRCESSSFRRDVAELIKNLSDRLGRVQLILAGVAADLTELVSHIPSIRRNIFALRVPKMSDQEVMMVVANGEREVGFAFEGAASELIAAISRGSPYIANLLCHHAGHAALHEDRLTVLASDVAAAVAVTSAEFESRIAKPVQARLHRLIGEGQADTLNQAAAAALSADGPFGLADIQEFNHVDAATAKSTVELLLNEGILTLIEDDEERGKSYEFAQEGLPVFLWITATQQKLSQNKPAP
jgi:Cdc6-like AAA superfamily ATPase